MSKFKEKLEHFKWLLAQPEAFEVEKDKPVYVVLEHHKRGSDAILHGIYHCKEWAEGKKKQIERKYEKSKKKPGYICILKKKVV